MSMKRSEAELLSQRVQDSKKDIERLKAELAQLVQRGLNTNAKGNLDNKTASSLHPHNIPEENPTKHVKSRENTKSPKKVKTETNKSPNKIDCKSPKKKTLENKPNENILNEVKSNMKLDFDEIKAQHVPKNDKIFNEIKPPTVTKHDNVLTEIKTQSVSNKIHGQPLGKSQSNLVDLTNTLEGNGQKVEKKRSYDVDEAREYMRRQKERRLEQMRMKKNESRNLESERKQKLLELQQKSLQIVHRNRERSKSREKKLDAQTKQFSPKLEPQTKHVTPRFEVATKPHYSPKSETQSKSQFSDTQTSYNFPPPRRLPISEKHIKDQITVRSPIEDPSTKIKRAKAATTIQSYYKGYRQRKIFRESLSIRRELESQARKLVERDCKKNALDGNLAEIVADLKKFVSAEKLEVPPAEIKKKKKLPDWLESGPHSPSYNFISTVKKKLNLATAVPPKSTSDIGIQSEDLRSPNQTVQEIKEIIKRNLSEEHPSRHSDLEDTYKRRRHHEDRNRRRDEEDRNRRRDDEDRNRKRDEEDKQARREKEDRYRRRDQEDRQRRKNEEDRFRRGDGDGRDGEDRYRREEESRGRRRHGNRLSEGREEKVHDSRNGRREDKVNIRIDGTRRNDSIRFNREEDNYRRDVCESEEGSGLQENSDGRLTLEERRNELERRVRERKARTKRKEERCSKSEEGDDLSGEDAHQNVANNETSRSFEEIMKESNEVIWGIDEALRKRKLEESFERSKLSEDSRNRSCDEKMKSVTVRLSFEDSVNSFLEEKSFEGNSSKKSLKSVKTSLEDSSATSFIGILFEKHVRDEEVSLEGDEKKKSLEDSIKSDSRLPRYESKSKNDSKFAKSDSKSNKSNRNHSNNNLNLDLKQLDSLKLKSKHSDLTDSDTSRNVPDLSSEDIKTASNPTYSKPKEDEVFKKPFNIPKKNKKKEATLAAQEEDYKLEMNLKKIQNLRLRRREHVIENTMDYGRHEDKSNENNVSYNSKRKDEEVSKPHNLLTFPSNEIDYASRRSSIISYNKCNYSHKSASETEDSIDAKELYSFRKYMKDLDVSGKIRYDFPKRKASGAKALVAPAVSLKPCDKENVEKKLENVVEEKKTENVDGKVGKPVEVVLKDGQKNYAENVGNSNQIHVKVEAELHLLNDFHESMRQFMAVEKSLLDLQNKSNTTIFRETRDTQTSFLAKTVSNSRQENSVISISQNSCRPNDSLVETESNSSRNNLESSLNNETIIEDNPDTSLNNLDSAKGSLDSISTQKNLDFSQSNRKSSIQDFVASAKQMAKLEQNNKFLSSLNLDNSLISALEISELNDTLDETKEESPDLDNTQMIVERNSGNLQAGISLGMFEQLIRDEDARIKNLKTILKIREKALLDRTKGELAWLEIQKKHLLETGKPDEASAVKKKQRGIIIKLQHEKHEMQKLKQMQKAASKERKTILKEQRNMIKAQLSTFSGSLTKIRRTPSKDRRKSGPVKVYQTTETSLSRKSSVGEEIIYASRSESVISRITETGSVESDKSLVRETVCCNRTENAKRSLLMREAALQKRRREAEKLLQWHQKLLEEEKKITELEMAASNIINQVPSVTIENSKTRDKYTFKGSQLNVLWENMTGLTDKKFEDSETYNLSQVALERFCKDARKISNKEKGKLLKDEEKVEEEQPNLEQGIKQSESTLNEIIQNISNITDEISELYKLSSVKKLKKQEFDHKVPDISIHKGSIKEAERTKKKISKKLFEEPKSELDTSSLVEDIVSDKSNEDGRRSSSEEEELKTEVESTISSSSTTIHSQGNMSVKSKGSVEDNGAMQGPSLVVESKSSNFESKSSNFKSKSSNFESKSSNFESKSSEIESIKSSDSFESDKSETVQDKSEIPTKSEEIQSEVRIESESVIVEEDRPELKKSQSIEDDKSEDGKSVAESVKTYAEIESENVVLKEDKSETKKSQSVEDDNKSEDLKSVSKSIKTSVEIESEIVIAGEDKSEMKKLLSIEDNSKSEDTKSFAESVKTSAEIESEILAVNEDKSANKSETKKSPSIEDSDKIQTDNSQVSELLKHSEAQTVDSNKSMSVLDKSQVLEDKSKTEVSAVSSLKSGKISKSLDKSEVVSEAIEEEDADYVKSGVSEESSKVSSEDQISISPLEEGLDIRHQSEDKSVVQTDEDKSEIEEYLVEDKSEIEDREKSVQDSDDFVLKSSELNRVIQESSEVFELSKTSETTNNSKPERLEELVTINEVGTKSELSSMHETQSAEISKLSEAECAKSVSEPEDCYQNETELEKLEVLDSVAKSEVELVHSENIVESKSRDVSPKSTSNLEDIEDVSEEIKSNESSVEFDKSVSEEKLENEDIQVVESKDLTDKLSSNHRSKIASSNLYLKSDSDLPSEDNLKIPSLRLESTSLDVSENLESEKEEKSKENLLIEDLGSDSPTSKLNEEISSEKSSEDVKLLLELKHGETELVVDFQSKNNVEEISSIMDEQSSGEDHGLSEDDSSKITDHLGERSIESYFAINKEEIEANVSEETFKQNSTKHENKNDVKLSEDSKVSDFDTESENYKVPVIDVAIKSNKIVSNSEGSSPKESLDENLSKSVDESINRSFDEKSLGESVGSNRSPNDSDAKIHFDVKKRVSEILADASLSNSVEEKSPRMHELHLTTSGLVSPDISPELGSPVEKESKVLKDIGSEAEELLRKQLAIDQEIKELKQQQQQANKEYYIYLREIPNKPPPPYKPPVQPQNPIIGIIPTSFNQIQPLIETLAKMFYKAHKDNNLYTIKFPEVISISNINKPCQEFIFDLCKEKAIEHYKQFEELSKVSWMKLEKHSFKKQLNAEGLKEYLGKKLKEILFGDCLEPKQNMILKWSQKKCDNVDRLLILESAAEEAEWINYDKDELVVKNEVTNDIMNMLLQETAEFFASMAERRKVKNVC